MKFQKSQLFAIQLDELANVSLSSQLLVLARYMLDGGLKEKFLICKTLGTTTRAQDALEIFNNFFDWENLVVHAMLGSRSGFEALVK